MNGREVLKAKIDGLSDTATRFVTRMVASLSSPPTSTIKETNAWISGSSDWVEYFGLALSVHHGTTIDALGLNGYETVFANACESVGWKVERAESMTQRFSDLTVTDIVNESRKLSLKSTAALKISKRCAHISKLTEAAWIQDTRSARVRLKINSRALQGVHERRRLNHDASRLQEEERDSRTVSARRDTYCYLSFAAEFHAESIQ